MCHGHGRGGGSGLRWASGGVAPTRFRRAAGSEQNGPRQIPLAAPFSLGSGGRGGGGLFLLRRPEETHSTAKDLLLGCLENATNTIRSPLPKTRGILKLGTSKLCSLVYTPDLGLYRATLFPPALSKPAPPPLLPGSTKAAAPSRWRARAPGEAQSFPCQRARTAASTDAAHSCSHGCANSSTYGCTDWHSDKYVDGSIRGPLQIHMS